jgi:hypothetical protein
MRWTAAVAMAVAAATAAATAPATAVDEADGRREGGVRRASHRRRRPVAATAVLAAG